MLVSELIIYSANVQKQSSFYTNVLGLNKVESDNDDVVLNLGDSNLIIRYAPNVTPYHFAINIP